MVVIYLLSLALFVSSGLAEPSRKDQRGPVFRTEPSSRVEFSNSSGTELRCNADGIPTPRLTWQTREGGNTRDVAGLRYTRSDGTLVFPPFARNDYRQDVHDTVYQCLAANTVGSIVSREVHVRGVIKQRFNPQVYDDFVVRGNTAVLRCHLPTFVKEYVSVDSWIRNDDYVLKMTDTRIRSYTVLYSGELLIHETQEKDAEWSYRCQTRHRLTGEMVVSISAGKITVTEPHASTLPRVTFNQAQVRAEEGSPVQLPCVAQGNPPPTYRWMKDENGGLSPVKEDGRVWMVQGTLNIRKVVQKDAGKYQCIVRNSIGERRIESALIVTAPLQVTMLPPHQVLNTGQEATFTCNVTGYPVHTISWKKDQRTIVASNRIQLLSRDVLHIVSLRREDRGMYQCFVYNDNDGAQGTAELKISDVPPSVISVFPEQTAHPGGSASLKCTATGNPPPRITWYLDGSIIGRTGRISIGDYNTEHAHVVGFLNITDVRVEDGGEYKCQVSNDVGSTSHSARLNVYGPTFVRPMPNVTAISGEDLMVRCPYGGYPIKAVRWFKGGILLPLHHRQKVSHGGTLSIQSVQRAADEGEYSCVVRSMDGETATGTTFVSVVVSPVIDPHFFRESNTVDEGARTKLVCIVTKGDPPLRFHWLKNGLPFLAHGETTVQTTEDSSIVTFKKVNSADRGLYTCVATNVASSANMTMQLIVNVPPQFTVEPKNSTVVLGNTVWLDCAAVGFPAPSILWKKLIYTENTAGDFTYVHSSPRAHRYNNGTLVISDAEESDAGAYLCQANNGIGAGLSKIVSLQVLVPPRFKESFQSRATREGLNATLKCDATGHAPITITWQKNKTTLDAKSNKRYFIRNISKKHQTTSELQILNAARNDTGKYTCTAVSEIGMDESVIQFLVQGLPDAPSNLTVLNTTSRSVSLFWEVAHNGNSHITGSIVQYQTVSDTHWNGQTSQLIVSGAENSATLRALTPVTLYFVRVIAENALGQSRPSAVINVTTEEEAPSGSPREVQVHSTGAQSIKVMWKPPSEETQHGHIKGYYIGYRISNSPENYIFKQVESNSEKEQQSTYITGLQPFTKYDIVVKAYNSAGAGPKSSKITGKTLETAPTSSPAFGKRETGLPFYKNVALVVPVVVSSLVILVLLFAIVVCFRKHSQDRRGRHDYDNRKPVGDSLMMSDMTKQLPAKSTKFSHYTCPAGKTDYAEPYTCNDSAASRQGSDGLFATIKRCPTRPIYMSASYKQGSDAFCTQHSTTHEGSTRSEPTSNEKWSNPRNNSKPMR
ncbi:unnamed protein product [Larinioides sclopetarius]|uniref:Down syndrome cell adhesion molecule-like protein Dscam2 n=1 Tax=Larinioides sclopetarius TaxID=280406 RepID=A0AAV1Z2Y9_9ARAC